MRICNAFGIAIITCILVVVMNTNAGAQAPDLKVDANDISFSPSNDIHDGTPVTIFADIHNIGECYIILGDDADYAEYDETFVVNTYRARLRLRTVSGNTVSGRVSIGIYNTGLFTTSNSSWTEITTPNINATGAMSSMRVTLDAGGSSEDLAIDWIAIDRWTGSSWTQDVYREAEDYDAGGSTVDRIWPQDISVEFYVGDPDASGVKINGTKIVGTSQTVETGTVTYLGDGEVTVAQMDWTAPQAGHYDMYVNILTGNEGLPNWGNNRAFSSLGVYAYLDVAKSPPEIGTISPVMGNDYKYYGQTVTVSQSPDLDYQLAYWTIDAVHFLSAPSINVSMTHDHVVAARYVWTGAVPTLSTLGYSTLALVIVGIGLFYLKKKRNSCA